MASKQAGWRIYKQQMGLLDHGDALWEPAPIYSYKRVKLGDVGYIRRGRFHLLFSAGRPLGPRQLGVDVPLTFEPLDVGPIIFSQPRLPGYLCTSTVKETGAGLGASICTTPALEPGASFSFELTEKQGAALVTKYRTYREDIELESAFEEYTKRHYDSWVTFARNARHGNDVKPVLVTGVDMTRDFAMIAYSNNSSHLSSEFTTSVPLFASASASAWGTWHTQGLVHTNCGPQLCSPPPSPDTLDLYPSDANQVDVTPNEYNQCVFIRYYTMRRRALMFPRVIKAAAGPHDLGPGNNYDEIVPELTMQLSSDSDTGSDGSGDSTISYSSSITSYESELEVFHNASSEEEDTFDIIADYVFRNSEAETVLIHHSDIAKIREGMPGTEIPDIFSERQPYIEVDGVGVGRVVEKRDEPVPSTSQQNTQDVVEPTPSKDPDVSSLKGDNRRHSARSETSNGASSTISLLESRSRWNSLRFSLSSNVSSLSSSSALTRFSGSTVSTSLTALSSGTIRKQPSRGSVLQKEKRFSSVRLVEGIPSELDELSRPITPGVPASPTVEDGTSRRSKTVPQRTSSDGRSTHVTEHGVLPPPPKLSGRKYAASLTSLLRKRESSDETRSVDAITETSSLGRRARFKRFVKSVFKI